jgi:hypothetical protein
MKAVLLATVCFGVATTHALAVDWKIKSQLGETFDISDNRDLRKTPVGLTYAPVSSLMFEVLGRTPTMTFATTTNLSYRSYFGPGAVNTTDALDKDAQARFTKKTRLTTYDIGASWSERDAGNVQLEDIGFRTVSGTITTYALDGGFKHQISPIDTLSFTTRGSSVTFSNAQNSYDDIGSTASWARRVSRTIDVTGLVSYYFQDKATSDTTIWRATGGINARLTPTLTFSGTAGAAFHDVKSTTAPANPTPFSGGSSVGWIADVMLAYRLRATTRISLTAARSIAPDALGETQQRDSFNVSLTEEINRRSSLSFSSGFSRNGASGSGGASDVINATAAYSYRLTPELNSSLAYRYAQRNDSTGSARSNAVTLSVRKDVTILP